MAKKEVKDTIKELQVQNEIRDLEDFYVNGTIVDVNEKLEELKIQKTTEMIQYAQQHEKPIYNKDGDVIDSKVVMNPVVVNNLFFKSICPLGNKIPIYNAEKLALIYEYYLYLVTEVNDKIGDFPSSLASFCKLAGITTKELRELRRSNDIETRNIVEKIYDEIGDNNLSMAQLGIVKGTATQFKLKTQNEMVEKQQPNVNITYKEVINTDRINQNIEKYKALLGDK